MVDKTSSIPLYVQIQDRLYEQIRSGQLVPGTRVPSELELVTLYNVSRMTARKALDGLVAKGHLFRRRGKGTFVADDVLSYDLSTMLSFSGTLRAHGYEVFTEVLRQEVIPGSPTVTDKLELRPGSLVVLVRRLRYVEGRPAAIHTSYMDHRIYAPILQMDLSRESLLACIERVSGTRIAYTKDSVRAAVVSSEDMDLLEIPKTSPILEVEGLAFNENGQPTRLTRAVYRSDLFKLVVTNTGNQGTALKITDGPTSG